MRGALLLDDREPVADLDALDRVDAHHRLGDIRIETVEHRLTPAGLQAARDDVDTRADRIAFLAQGIHVALEFRQTRGVGAEERIVVDRLERGTAETDGAELAQIAPDTHTTGLRQGLLRDGAGGHAHAGLTRRRPPAAAVIAHAVFLHVGIVRVPGAELVLDVGVVTRFLIGVLDQQGDRRAGGVALEHAREDAYAVVLAALGGMARLAGFAAIEIVLQIGFREGQARRATVDDADVARAMTLPRGGQRERDSEGIA